MCNKGSFVDIDSEINWNDMRFLLALERSGSAIKAARMLSVSHQTVSRRLSELERGLGARLVDRSGLNWQLTVCGQGVVRQAEEIEGSIRAAALSARSKSLGMAGRVRITSAGLGFDQFIMPALDKLSKKHPMIEYDLIADNAPLDIQSGQFDIAVRFVKSAPGHLLGRNAGALEFALYGLPEFIDKIEKAVLEKKSISVPVVAMLTSHLRTTDWLAGIVDLESHITRVSDLGVLFSSIKNGLGVGFLPVVVGREAGNLAECVSIARKSPFDVWVLTNEDSRKSDRIKTVAAQLFGEISSILEQNKKVAP